MVTRAKYFGEIAVEFGFVTPEQVEQALTEQSTLEGTGQPHKLTGVLLIEMGAMNTAQVVRVLKAMGRPDVARA